MVHTFSGLQSHIPSMKGYICMRAAGTVKWLPDKSGLIKSICYWVSFSLTVLKRWSIPIIFGSSSEYRGSVLPIKINTIVNCFPDSIRASDKICLFILKASFILLRTRLRWTECRTTFRGIVNNTLKEGFPENSESKYMAFMGKSVMGLPSEKTLLIRVLLQSRSVLGNPDI